MLVRSGTMVLLHTTQLSTPAPLLPQGGRGRFDADALGHNGAAAHNLGLRVNPSAHNPILNSRTSPTPKVAQGVTTLVRLGTIVLLHTTSG